MTYCVALNLEQGMILVSDTRTNAGVDHVSCYQKMFRFEVAGERVVFIMTSGNLATSQAVIERLQQDIHHNADKHLLNVASVFEMAELVGRYSQYISNDAENLSQQQSGFFDSNFLVGGQIKGQPAKMYYVYPQGNCITTTEDTPYFQIGESKYGKPILDRIVTYQTDLDVALKAVLLSFDSTIRSNLSVGFPLDLVVYPKDSLQMPKGRRIVATDPYMRQICQQWGSGLQQLLLQFDGIPDDYKA